MLLSLIAQILRLAGNFCQDLEAALFVIPSHFSTLFTAATRLGFFSFFRGYLYVPVYFEALYSAVLQSVALHSSLLPDSPFMFSVWTFFLRLICLAVVNIAVNGARYIPYLLYSSQQALVKT